MSVEDGPNAGLSLVDQVLVAARAVSCFDVVGFDQWLYAIERIREGDLGAGEWHRLVHDDGHEWFWFVDAQGQLGRSQATLPPDVRLGETVHVPSTGRPATEFLEAGCQLLEAGLIPDGIRPSEDQWQTIRWARECARPDWPEECTRSVLMRSRADLTGSPEAVSDLPRVLVDDVWGDVRTLRNRYVADLSLTVGLGWAVRLVVKVLNSAEVSAAQKGAVLEPWLVDEEFRPLELLARTLSRVLDIGQHPMVATIISEDRAASEQLVAQALACEDLDGHLQALYRALPQSFASLTLARFLASYGEESQRPRFRKLTTLLDERLVRQVYAFQVQLLDVRSNGGEWARHRLLVRMRSEEGGPGGADQAIHQLSAGELFYPTRIAAQLAPPAT